MQINVSKNLIQFFFIYSFHFDIAPLRWELTGAKTNGVGAGEMNNILILLNF